MTTRQELAQAERARSELLIARRDYFHVHITKNEGEHPVCTARCPDCGAMFGAQLMEALDEQILVHQCAIPEETTIAALAKQIDGQEWNPAGAWHDGTFDAAKADETRRLDAQRQYLIDSGILPNPNQTATMRTIYLTRKDPRIDLFLRAVNELSQENVELEDLVERLRREMVKYDRQATRRFSALQWIVNTHQDILAEPFVQEVVNYALSEEE